MTMFLTRFRGYFWDKENGTYVSRWTGKPIKSATILRAGRSYVTKSVISNMKALADQYFSGKITLEELQIEVMQQYKSAWLIHAMLGRGGRAAMAQADWDEIGDLIESENQYLYDLMLGVASGEISQDQLKISLAHYAMAAEIAYWTMLSLSMAEAGNTEERRILNLNVENCNACIDYADMGWQPIDSLPEPKTECDCLRNCQCHKEYR